MTESVLSAALLNEQTAILLSGITGLVMPSLMVVYKATRETYPGFGLWAAAFVCNGVGSLLLGSEAFVPIWLSLWLGNILILAFPALLALGLNVFLRRPTRWLGYGLSVILYALIQGVFIIASVDAATRSIAFNGFVLIYTCIFGWNIYSYASRISGKVDHLALSVVFLSAAICVVRTVNILLKSSYENPVLYQDLDTLFILLMVLASVSMVIVIISMNQQRLEVDMHNVAKALEEKTSALEDLNQELTVTSLTDFLTGIGNRRFFDSEYRSVWSRSVQDDTSLTVLVLDLDCFKLYNDSMGHLAGDECLQRVGRLLMTHPGLRGSLVARVGGEEFAVVIEKGADEGWALAEELVSRVASLSIPHPSSTVGPLVTISIGVATRLPNDNSGSKLLSRADHALYHAKTAGRNQALVA